MNPYSPPGPIRSERIHLRPRLQEMLQSLQLDVTYERGSGDSLFFRNEAGEEIEVLDMVGGYGSLLLGHCHPALVARAQELLSQGRPMHTQGSNRKYAQRLAAELSRRAPADYAVIFGNSGTEAVEVAMKHAMLQTGGRTFITLAGAFHGKTLGALQLTHNSFYRDDFLVSGIRVLCVAGNDVPALEAAFEEAGSSLAGFIFEAIQGEGGVRLLGAEFAQHAASLCRKQGAALIADECQTGLGRTGRFLACESLGVEPDSIVLSKALGGGLAKISACLIKQSTYSNRFDLRHTSTFADDDYSSAIALETLELIDEKLLSSVRCKGKAILEQLQAVKHRFPKVIKEIRGAGLMLGIEFHSIDAFESGFLLRFLSSQDDLLKWISAYFLHAHRIRVLPVLSAPFTLRLQPSALITLAAIARFIHALEDVCARIQANDIVKLTQFLVQPGSVKSSGWTPVIPRESSKFFAYQSDRFWRREQDSSKPRVAWLCHLVDSDDLVTLEPAMSRINPETREALLARCTPHLGPVVMNSVDIGSPVGGTVKLYSILLPVTSTWFKTRLDAGELGLARALVQQGVDQAAALGCAVTSLGQHTSIVTANGRRIAAHGMTVTSGNSYAVALAVDAVMHAMAARGINPAAATLAIVGAGGNIGRACAAILAPMFRKTILIGSNSAGAGSRLRHLASRLPNKTITCETSVSIIHEAQIVVSAPNTSKPILKAHHFRYGAIVCDLAVPASIEVNAPSERRDVLFVKGGVAHLPYEEDLEIPGFHLPHGQVFACMAEGILLGMEGVSGSGFTGSLHPDRVAEIRRIAERNSFTLAEYKPKCVLGTHIDNHESHLSIATF